MVPASFHDFFNGCASVAGALIGLLFVALIGLVVVLHREHAVGRGDLRMLAVLFVLYGLQLANAVQLDGAPREVSGISRQGGLAILFFIFGIARSWQLAGARNVSLASTVTAVIQRPADRSAGAAARGDPEDEGGSGA